MIYQRYLAKEMRSAVIIVLLAFLALFGFFDLVQEVRDVGNRSYGIFEALLYVTLRLPGRVYEFLPIAALIGTLYALSNLARHSEINVLRVSGISTFQLLMALFRPAVGLAIVTLLVGELLAPPAEKLAQQVRAQAFEMVVSQEFKSGVWVKDGRTFVNVDKVHPDASLEGITIYEFDDASRLASVAEARRGDFVPPGQWRLQGIVRTSFKGEPLSSVVDELLWSSALTPDILSVLMVSPERMSVWHLFSYIRHLSENHQRTGRYEIALWKKLVYPLAVFVMVALALPFGYSYNRVAGVSLRIFTGVMIGVGFYMLNALFSSLGAINAWPPFLTAVTPASLFLVGATLFIAWVERR